MEKKKGELGTLLLGWTIVVYLFQGTACSKLTSVMDWLFC